MGAVGRRPNGGAGGLGLFYSQIPQTLQSSVLRSRQTEQLVVDKTGFLLFGAEFSVGRADPSSRLEPKRPIDPAEAAARHAQLQRQIAPRLFGSIGYTWKSGSDALRTRVITGTGNTLTGVPGPSLQFESSGRSSAHEIHLTASGSIDSRLSLFGSYQWTRAFQDTDGPFTVSADSSNLAGEWGPAPVARHQVGAGASISLPGDITISPFLRATSAMPFNITTGMDNNGDTQFADRPALAAPGTPGAVVTP